MMERLPSVLTDAQRATFESLASLIDEADVTAETDGTVIFEGYSVDGLSVGIVSLDGSVEWVAGEVALPQPASDAWMPR